MGSKSVSNPPTKSQCSRRTSRLAPRQKSQKTKRSDDEETSEDGGLLERRRPGRNPSALERAFVDLEVGEIAGPLRTPEGFHIIKLVDREELGVQPFSDVKDRIVAQLAQQEMMRQEQIWLKELRLKTFIDVRM